MFHLLVGKLDTLRPYCIGRLGVGDSRQTEVYKGGADEFFMERLAKKQSENKAEFRHVVLCDGTYNKLAVLGKQPNIVVNCEMRECPKRIDSHAMVIVKRKLIKQFL